MLVKNFQDIINSYDSFLLDIWGVVHDGHKPYNGTVQAINDLLGMKGKEVLFLSNTPRPRDVVHKKLVQMGIEVDISKIITSGDVAIEYLDAFHRKDKIYHLGKERNQDILRDNKHNEIVDNIEEADLLLLTAFIDHHEDLSQYDHLLERVAKGSMKVLCPNPDKEVIEGGNLRRCAGFLASRFEDFGGIVKYIGKPHGGVFLYALERLENKNLQRVIMIGDTIGTDVVGASGAGICSGLVLTGNSAHFMEFTSNAQILGEKISASCKSSGLDHCPTEVIWGLF